jgi:replicative superfamily II helicase
MEDRAHQATGAMLRTVGDLASLGLDAPFLERLAESVHGGTDAKLTEFQSAVFADSAAMRSSCNLLVAGPTSAGKTLVASVIAALTRQKFPTGKIVYAVPLRALVSEKAEELRLLFADAQVIEVSSDYPRSDYLIRTDRWDIAVVVFEKLYQWLGDTTMVPKLVRETRLCIIDELQIVGERVRGEKLEMLVSLLRWVQTKVSGKDRSLALQILGLGVSREIAGGMAKWLDAEVVPAGKVARPIPLYHLRLNVTGGPTLFNESGELVSPDCLPMAAQTLTQVEARPSIAELAVLTVRAGLRLLVYVKGRRDTETVARAIANALGAIGVRSAAGAALADLEDTHVRDALDNTLRYSVGFHHGHMSLRYRLTTTK